jgi:hypothetical protein
MTRISALVVARNEEARLPACLESLAPADEIVVVLDRSTDESLAIAWKRAHRVIEGDWPLEGDRRNAGIAACTGDWVLEVDADERVPPELWAEIRRVTEVSPHAFHPVRIDNHLGDRLIRRGWAGGFGATLKPILFRRGAKRWGSQRVHPGQDWTGTEGERITAHGLHHALAPDISGLLRRLDRLSADQATDLLAGGRIGSLPGHLLAFPGRFLGALLGHGGWREGGWGVLLAFCTSMLPLLSHLKARLEPEKHRPE